MPKPPTVNLLNTGNDNPIAPVKAYSILIGEFSDRAYAEQVAAAIRRWLSPVKQEDTKAA